MNAPLPAENESPTPGPWAYNVQSDVPREIRLKREHWEVGSTVTRKGIAIVFQAESNACLIAAAPDLLALAKKYASECAECGGSGERVINDTGGDPMGDSAVSCPECADIRAVIDKAEGRA